MNTTKASPHRLYRIKDKAILFGICAGIADYFDFNVTMVRIIVFVMLLVFQLPVIITYILARLILKDKPRELQDDVVKDEFYRNVRTQPSDTVANIKHRFSKLEQRLQRMEKRVTSKEYQFDHDLNHS